MSDPQPMPNAHRLLGREIAALQASRDDLPAGSHLRALFEITLDHLETCAAHLQRSIRIDPRPTASGPTQVRASAKKPSRSTLAASR